MFNINEAITRSSHSILTDQVTYLFMQQHTMFDAIQTDKLHDIIALRNVFVDSDHFRTY
jgi:hypothetical protein